MYKLTNIRKHQQTSFFSDDDDTKLSAEFNLAMSEREALARENSRKWALLWKSIIRSSLGTTAYPYCLYIRSLDLVNLDLLLNDVLFQRGVQDSVFSDDMSQFLDAEETPKRRRTQGGQVIPKRLNMDNIMNLVGESITSMFLTYAIAIISILAFLFAEMTDH